jgi:predicted GNAT superfamily acetyltransferase
MILVRDCSGFDELEACVQLQIETWGYDDSDVIPRKAFLVGKKIGGQVIGAFDTDLPGAGPDGSPESLVGFAMSLPGVKTGNGEPCAYLHSHMLAVRESYRNRGLGAQLKLQQRLEALSRNINLMEWTFDPLEIKNAHLNIERLGAIVRQYIPNLYGTVSSALQAGLPTDRLIAEWWIQSRRVRRLLDGEEGSLPENEITARVAVPGEIYEWKATGDPRAGEAQTRVREKLMPLLQNGLTILQHRVLTDGSGELGLGKWEEERNFGRNEDR